MKGEGKRFLKKCRGVSHSHSLPLQIQKKKKEIEKKEYNKKKQIKKVRVDPLIHWIDSLLYEEK